MQICGGINNRNNRKPDAEGKKTKHSLTAWTQETGFAGGNGLKSVSSLAGIHGKTLKKNT
jgi:hypothetical protein